MKDDDADPYVLEIPAGMDVRQAAGLMCANARMRQVEVVTIFNGHGLKATPKSSADDVVRDWSTLQRQRERAEAEKEVQVLRGLVDALRPFAALGGGPDKPAFFDLPPDVVLCEYSRAVITVGDVRAARAALARAEGKS
jgi:hypothetical protein